MKLLAFRSLVLCGLAAMLVSCGGKKQPPTEEAPVRVVQVPAFSSDSAFSYVAEQVAMGPRVPNTNSHVKAGDRIVARLKSFGATVKVQEFEATTFDGKKLFLRNIIASFSPKAPKRVLLATHWDTRPFADKDKVKPDAAFDGASDGASGVGILLEIARVLNGPNKPLVGVDMIFFDGEDWGEKEGNTIQATMPEGQLSWWCLGSQYWSKNKHQRNYSAFYGILLDMAGTKDGLFFKEGYSDKFAPRIVDKVWKTAARLGHASRFPSQVQGGIMDDHYFVNTVGGIPMIDIIPFDPTLQSFPAYHHTTADNMSAVSKETLQIVGSVILQVLYEE